MEVAYKVLQLKTKGKLQAKIYHCVKLRMYFFQREKLMY